MNKHIAYGRYLARHKYFVLLSGIRLGYWSLLWRLIIHDWSKFLPCEWLPYAEYFYGTKRSTEWFDLQEKYGCAELAPWGECVEDHFNEAWLHHQHWNKHHWQYWVLREDSGGTKIIPMQKKYIKEMVCDWMGAGRAITGKWEAKEWYLKNESKIVLHPETRKEVERLLEVR